MCAFLIGSLVWRVKHLKQLTGQGKENPQIFTQHKHFFCFLNLLKHNYLHKSNEHFKTRPTGASGLY